MEAEANQPSGRQVNLIQHYEVPFGIPEKAVLLLLANGRRP